MCVYIHTYIHTHTHTHTHTYIYIYIYIYICTYMCLWSGVFPAISAKMDVRAQQFGASKCKLLSTEGTQKGEQCQWSSSCQSGVRESHSVVYNSLRPHGLYSPWNSPVQNTGVCCHAPLQGIFPTQWSNPGLLHCRWILYPLSHQGSPVMPVNDLNAYYSQERTKERLSFSFPAISSSRV